MNSQKGTIITANGWMYDENQFPPDQCVYVVALNAESIPEKLTDEEMSRYKYYVYINSSHFFKEFNMPKFPILFIPGWRKHFKSKVIDYDMINFAVKNSLELLNYTGEHGERLDMASTQKELKFHGIINSENPLSMIDWHPEIIQNQPQHLKGYE